MDRQSTRVTKTKPYYRSRLVVQDVKQIWSFFTATPPLEALRSLLFAQQLTSSPMKWDSQSTGCMELTDVRRAPFYCAAGRKVFVELPGDHRASTVIWRSSSVCGYTETTLFLSVTSSMLEFFLRNCRRWGTTTACKAFECWAGSWNDGNKGDENKPFYRSRSVVQEYTSSRLVVFFFAATHTGGSAKFVDLCKQSKLFYC